MLSPAQFKKFVVEPSLSALGSRYNSPAAVQLLMGTAIQESRLTYLHQLGGGPAVGVFQMEPATHEDIWLNFLAHRPVLAEKILEEGITLAAKPEEMAWNLRYAAVMCRVHYFRRPEDLPAFNDIHAQAAYWKEHYNTHLGAGTEEEYLENWADVYGQGMHW